MPRPNKKVVEKTPGTKLSRKLSWLRLRPPSTFLCRSVRWMLAAPRATAPPQNLLKIIPGTKTSFRSATRRHKPCLLIILSKLISLKNRAGTTKRIGIIKMVAIATPRLQASGLYLGHWGQHN